MGSIGFTAAQMRKQVRHQLQHVVLGFVCLKTSAAVWVPVSLCFLFFFKVAGWWRVMVCRAWRGLAGQAVQSIGFTAAQLRKQVRPQSEACCVGLFSSSSRMSEVVWVPFFLCCLCVVSKVAGPWWLQRCA
jgi:hypothetical protein